MNNERSNGIRGASGVKRLPISRQDVMDPAAEPPEMDAPRMPLWKRVFDLTFVMLSSPCWLPLMILLAMGIKLIDSGPLLFRQERVGFRGRRFICLKFRSMKVNVETRSHEGLLDRIIETGCPMTKLDAVGDPRLIPYGRIFRASGLDEIPQILNIIRGEMSIVGPRPCTPYEFEKLEPAQRQRVSVPPGLTGYWQVNGKNKTTFNEMIALDLFYAKHMSLWMDLRIMAKTIPALLSQVFEFYTVARGRHRHEQTVGEVTNKGK
jgi:lipopolysaccharide/colanic/teichoic acid biosynthesis glycosyltransferase